MKKILIIFLSLLALVGCGTNDNPNISSSAAETFTVTWLNYDSSVLEIDEDVLYGSVPIFNNDLPLREGDDQYSYVFSGWSPNPSRVVKDVTYIAQFEKTLNKYTITWKNYDGTILEVDEDVPYGTMPSYDGETPYKEGTNKYSYVFDGWSPKVETVRQDITYFAQYEETLAKYSVTWKNYDGAVLEVDEDVPYGTMPSYDGETPYKEGTNKYSYVFDGWSPIIDTVTSDAVYVAEYTSKINTYTITWKNDNGEILEVDENVAYGTMPSYDGETPYKKGFDTGFIFDGWSPTIDFVTSDITYYAIYEEFKLSTFTISYNLNGGSNDIPSQIKQRDIDIQLPENIPTYGGYHFIGWNNIYEDKVYSPGDTFTLNGNVTMYAMWCKECTECDGTGAIVEKEDCTWCSNGGNYYCSYCGRNTSVTIINGLGAVCSTCLRKPQLKTCTHCNGVGYYTHEYNCDICHKRGYFLPEAPTAVNISVTEVVLTEIEGYEYSQDGLTWESSNTFSNLSPNTEYSFYQRRATDDKKPFGVTSDALKVKTLSI